MQWANFKSDGGIHSFPMVAGDGCLTVAVPEDMELVSITAASGVWLDDGSIVNTVEDPDSKKARAEEKATRGAPGNADGREDEAIQAIKDNPEMSQTRIMQMLRSLGIQRSRTWIGNKWFDIYNAGARELSGN
jgi:hypothetical protein